MEETKQESVQGVRIERFLDSVDHLSEPVKNIYSKDEESGKYVLNETVHSAISGTRNALSKVRTERDSYKSKIEELSSQVESFKSLKTEPEEAKAKKEMPNDQIEVLKKQLEDFKKKDEAKDKASQKSTVSAVISGAIAKHGAVLEATADVLSGKVKAVYENGEYVARVVDRVGNIRYGQDGDAPMSVDELMSEMKNSDGYRSLFMSSKVVGAGMKASSGVTPTSQKKRSEMSIDEKMADTLRKRGLEMPKS